MAPTGEDDDVRLYKVVVNHEEQYSIWPADRENAPGWRDAGRTGKKADCLGFIEEAWTDMRPLSLRKQMAEAVTGGVEQERPNVPAPHPQGMNPLVARLQEPQPIEVATHPRPDAIDLRKRVEAGHLFILFEKTGTKVRVNLTHGSCDLRGADFDAGTGAFTFSGNLVLNYNRVRCHGEIDVATLRGTGRLEFVEEV
jgi:uncharacterized protein YbdZ (MbtH family)